MIRHDYSQDVNDLLEEEIIEQASVDKHETGINKDRMRLPNRYDIAKYYKRHKSNIEKGDWRRKSAKELANISDDYKWQITYNFPASFHNNVSHKGVVYGGANVTYRRLYLILCEHFNNGEFFVDTYFDEVYPYTIKPEVDKKLDVMKYELLDTASGMLSDYVDENGKLLRGGKARIKEYERFAQEWEVNESPEIARLIKNDIINSLMTGQIPLNHITDTIKTQKKRESAGYTPNDVFFAMGDLIEHINLYINLGGNRKWETSQGILV